MVPLRAASNAASALPPAMQSHQRLCNNRLRFSPLHGKPSSLPPPLSGIFLTTPASPLRQLAHPSPQAPRLGSRRPQASYYEPFEFDEADYHKCSLQVLQGQEQTMTGFMLFQKEASQGEIEDPDRGLVVCIGGDSFHAIVLLLQGRQEARPLTADLLWRVLERGMEVSKREWTVVRVAITGLAESTFLGRIFFGDGATGEVQWDVDCRPSDATWLAIKCGAPIYIHQAVWDSVAAPLEDLKGQAQWQLAKVHQEMKAHKTRDKEAFDGGMSHGKVDIATVMTTVRRTDPEPLKLLKMELKVALAEEDYATAARIRDHPFTKMHLAAITAREEGDMEAASRYEQKLRRDIARVEAGGSVEEDAEC